MIEVSEAETERFKIKSEKLKIISESGHLSSSPFVVYMLREAEEIDQIPLSNFTDLAKFFGNVSAGSAQNVIALMAGLLGAAIGAFVTIWTK